MNHLTHNSVSPQDAQPEMRAKDTGQAGEDSSLDVEFYNEIVMSINESTDLVVSLAGRIFDLQGKVRRAVATSLLYALVVTGCWVALVMPMQIGVSFVVLSVVAFVSVSIFAGFAFQAYAAGAESRRMQLELFGQTASMLRVIRRASAMAERLQFRRRQSALLMGASVQLEAALAKGEAVLASASTLINAKDMLAMRLHAADALNVVKDAARPLSLPEEAVRDVQYK